MNELSKEAAREARRFFNLPTGKEFLDYISAGRPSISMDEHLHNFAFSAGKPAGYDQCISNIKQVLSEDRAPRHEQPDTLN